MQLPTANIIGKYSIISVINIDNWIDGVCFTVFLFNKTYYLLLN